jgi:antitoxin component YwqK of YwqJK toxin-antitoxin module
LRTPYVLSKLGALYFILLLAGVASHGQTRTQGGNLSAPGRVPGKSTVPVGKGFTRQTFHDKEKKVIKEVYQVKDTIRNVPHGRYVSYFLNGRIESRGEFSNNETSGVWEFYYETGKLKMRGILFKGENYGMWEYFFEGGQKNMEGIINKRDREGEWKWYYENGHLKEVGSYVKNQRDGYWKTYFEDGVLKGEIDYDADHGRYIEYYHTGKVRAEGPKSGSHNVGFWRYFDEDGTLHSDGEFTDGKKSGAWTTYYPSGKPASRGAIINDKPTGLWECWHENGTIAGKGVYQNGQKSEKWVTYSSEGKVTTEITYTDGRGEYLEYYESGKLKTRGLLLSEKREGTWEFYYETGQREGTCAYRSGKGVYYGYQISGALHTKGPMDGDLKTGTWEIYEDDGKLSGYYRPFYDDKKLSAEITGLAIKSHIPPKQTAQALGHTQKKPTARRNTGYFTPRYNEVQGVIFGTNPLWLAAGQLPLGIEFYLQERLGHEFEFIGIRDPFFIADSEVAPGKQYERGYSIAIKQKFYNPLNVGMWYFGQEIRFTNVGHFVNEISPNPGSTQSVFIFNAIEQRVEWGALLGYRLMRHGNADGLTVDAFISADIGYLNFDVDETNAQRFSEFPQHSFSSTFHFGVNLGNVFAFR